MTWLLASSGTSKHLVVKGTEEDDWPRSVCGIQQLYVERTIKRAGKGKFMSPCRRCQSLA